MPVLNDPSQPTVSVQVPVPTPAPMPGRKVQKPAGYNPPAPQAPQPKQPAVQSVGSPGAGKAVSPRAFIFPWAG
jgi:hypothetical protein